MGDGSEVIVNDEPPRASQGAQFLVPVTADTFIREDEETSPVGADAQLSVDTDAERVALMQFDTSALQPSHVVTSAKLRLWRTDDGESQFGTLRLFRVLQRWEQQAATWQQATAAEAWVAPGVGAGSRDPIPCGTFQLSPPETYVYVDITPAVVQGWIDAPGTNHGLALTVEDHDGHRIDFVSSDDPDPALHPTLTITATVE